MSAFDDSMREHAHLDLGYPGREDRVVTLTGLQANAIAAGILSAIRELEDRRGVMDAAASMLMKNDVEKAGVRMVSS